MKKGETLFARIHFVVAIVLKMLTPPMYSLERLEQYCRSRLARNSRAYLPRWFLAGLYKDYQRHEEARNEYLEIKRLGYMGHQDLLGYAEVLFRLKDVDGVIETLAPTTDKYPQDRDANWYLGVCYIEKEDFEKAAHYLEKAVQTRRRHRVDYWRPQFWVAYLLERVKRSIDVYRKGGYEDYWRLGCCYDRLGQLNKAIEAYSAALVLKPDSGDVRRNMALAYIKSGQSFIPSDLEAAEREVRKALDVDPDNAEAVTLLEKLDRLKKLSAGNGNGKGK